MSCCFVLLLIVGTVIGTMILVKNAGGLRNIDTTVEHVGNYQKRTDPNGMITLTPYEDIKNTFIILHDYD